MNEQSFIDSPAWKYATTENERRIGIEAAKKYLNKFEHPKLTTARRTCIFVYWMGVILLVGSGLTFKTHPGQAAVFLAAGMIFVMGHGVEIEKKHEAEKLNYADSE